MDTSALVSLVARLSNLEPDDTFALEAFIRRFQAEMNAMGF
jgi:hypothetical protein